MGIFYTQPVLAECVYFVEYLTRFNRSKEDFGAEKFYGVLGLYGVGME